MDNEVVEKTAGQQFISDVKSMIMRNELHNSDHRLRRIVLTNRELVAKLMHFCTEEFREVSEREILDHYITGAPEVEASPVMGKDFDSLMAKEVGFPYDVVFLATEPESGELIEVALTLEDKDEFSPGTETIDRTAYYGARTFDSQVAYGQKSLVPFGKTVKKVYAFYFLLNAPEDRNKPLLAIDADFGNIFGTAEELGLNNGVKIIVLPLGEKIESNNV